MDGSNTIQDVDVLERLRSASGFVFDLDGTLTKSGQPGERFEVNHGAPELLALLNERNLPYVVLTNGTSRQPSTYEHLLTAAGLPVSARHIMTPASVAADFFLSEGFRTVLVLGVESVWAPLRDAGLEVLLPGDDAVDPETRVDAVFAGWYREFSLDEIEVACEAVRNGAALYAASLVKSFRRGSHETIGSSRAICDIIEGVTGASAKAIGKPSSIALQSAAGRLNKDVANIAVVGDDPALEIRMAKENGATAIAVQPGSRKSNGAATHPEGHQPDATVRNLEELLKLLQ